MGHDKSASGVDEDRLAPPPEESEHPPLAGEDPSLIAVTKGPRRGAGFEMRLVRTDACRVLNPDGRNDLSATAVTVVGEQQGKPCIVTQHRVEAAIGRLLARAVDEPSRIGFRPH